MGAAPPEPPAGEVWLTPAQVRDARIEIAAIGERDLDDTILTSGTVSLDDQRTGHVLSPVTGRVVQVLAPLGVRLKKGDPLPIIESPAIATAVSNLPKPKPALTPAH